MVMIENSILKANREGRKAIVAGLTFASTQIVELAAHAGFDAINLDGEHGSFSPESIDEMCRLANAFGMSVTARVASIDAFWINLFLDRGVQGILGPHIESREDAQRLADACLFPPAGQRSWGGGRGTLFNDDHGLGTKGGKLDYAGWANANMIVSAQIESKKGYDNLDGILGVKGLMALAGGPNDFAASLGYPGEPDHPERQRLTSEIDERARKAGKAASSDLTVTLGIQDLLLGAARKFAADNRTVKVGA